MLILGFGLVVIGTITLGAGVVAQAIRARVFGLHVRETNWEIVALLVQGYVMISSIALLCGLFLPISAIAATAIIGLVLSPLLGLVQVLGSVISACLRFWCKPKQVACATLGTIFVAGIMLRVVGATDVNPDTGLYHLQAVRWLKEYGAVPGLANLSWGLGLASSWFAFWAVFDYGPLHGRVYEVAGCAAYGASALMAIRGGNQILEGRSGLAPYLRCMLPVRLGVMKWNLPSLGPDAAAWFLTWFLLCEVVDFLERAHGNMDGAKRRVLGFEASLPIIAACAIPVTKVASLWSVLYSVPLLLRLRSSGSAPAIRMCLVPVFVVLPWIGATLILTGYPIFPLPAGIAFSPFEWRVPREGLEALEQGAWDYLAHSLRVPPNTPRVDLLQMSFGRTLTGSMGFEAVVMASSLGVSACVAVAHHLARRTATSLLLVMHVLTVVALALWLCVAFPDMRYAFPLITAIWVIPLAAVAMIGSARCARLRLVTPYVVLLAMAAHAARGAGWTQLAPRRAFRTAFARRSLPVQPVREIKLSQTVTVRVPVPPSVAPNPEVLCWNAPVPCTHALASNLRPRGLSVRQGFWRDAAK